MTDEADLDDRLPCSCGHVSIIHHRRSPHVCLANRGCPCRGFSLAPDDIQHAEEHDDDAIGDSTFDFGDAS